MDKFKRYNNIAGWAVFAISLIAYVLTAAPTADWWDCMEFTATSYKLEVGHPPGAPLFMMIMRLFTMLSFGHTEWVGLAANMMSCTASAFCILFMFWTIVRLARKMYGGANGAGFDAGNKTHVWTVIGAGAVGALAYAFSDTFWFSAVESEVYALSSMFTALVVWLMMRWEEVADEPRSTRWLILIAYMMGLSIGVHILNLLTIPALVLIYYFRKTERATWWGVVLSLGASLAILGVIYKMIMPWTVNVGAWFDRVFVNSLGLPVNSGFAVWVLLLFALVGTAVWVTHRRGKVLLNTILLCVGVILIGYSSYASMVIRSSANPPMDSNNPDNAYALSDLLERKQYGSQPILRGQSFASPLVDYKYSTGWSMGDDGKYHSHRVPDYIFGPGTETLLPRLWDHNSANAYKSWLGDIRTRPVVIPDYNETYNVPTFGEHMRYMFTYQLNYMYWRYFMWNFVGRQDDVQGRGDILHGNWLSGVTPIDELYLGPQTGLPEEVERNPGRNTYFFLPFLLGVLGLIAQMWRDRRGTLIVAMLFGMMGLALVVYFNITPTPPRERDYIYAGSFYAFSIWIGLGVLWVQETVEKFFKKGAGSAIAATVVCALAAPVLMAAQGWDDHDRSGRSMGNAYGYNALTSTLPNSIVMNYGDNDTFPLWYNQEVENVRPDVRIMNMSYLGGEWYISQMLNAYNESAPVPLRLPMSVYRANAGGTYVQNVLGRPLALRTALDFVANADPKTKMEYGDGTLMDYIPADTLVLPVNKANALASGIVRPEDAHLMADSIAITLPKRQIDITQLALLDLLSNFDWSRPLYFTTPLLVQSLGLADWLQTDGWIYRLVPIKTATSAGAANIGRVDPELTYDLVMNRYRYGGSGTPGVNVDWHSVTNLRFVQHQHIFTRLANEFLAAGDSVRAVEVLDRSLAEYPLDKFSYDEQRLFPLTRVESYYAAGATERADELLEDYANTLCEYIEYYLRFTGRRADAVYDTLMDKIEALDTLALVAGQYGRTEQYQKIDAYLDAILGEETETPGTGAGAPPADDTTSAPGPTGQSPSPAPQPAQ